MLIFARKAQPTRRDPSFMKTFRLMNQFMVPGSYMRDDGRVEVAKFDWSEDVKVHQLRRRRPAEHQRVVGRHRSSPRESVGGLTPTTPQ